MTSEATTTYSKPVTTPGGMRIVNERPPEWVMSGCMSRFRVNPERTFWTYGDVIYNPGGVLIPDPIIAHEEQHGRQQAAYEGGPEAWWRRYLEDPRFRLEQEAEAHAVEYAYYSEQNRSPERRARALFEIARRLSSPLYQVAVTHQQAMKIIRVLSGESAIPGR